MMRKKLLFLTLVLGIGLISCQDKIEIDDDGLVDVTLTSSSEKYITKSIVSSGGYTTWDKSDTVYVVDVNGVPSKFTNTSVSGASEARFTGKLLANQGVQKYYAYHSARNTPCKLNGYNLSASWVKLEYLVDDDTKAQKKGDHCSMVAIPIKFDAQNPEYSKNFNFYHINNLIEAHVYPDEENKLANMEFDKVEFSMTTIESNKNVVPIGEVFEDYNKNNLKPFNTTVSFDMTQIIFDEEEEDVSLTINEGTEKIGKMTTTLTYPKGTTFSSRYTPDAKYYDIPIYALPTTKWFRCQFDVIFYNGDNIVYHVRKDRHFKGLKLAGLNDPNFIFEEDDVIVGP